MTGKIGQIKDSLQDARSGKLVFLSHCILNQNACVRGLASQPAVIRELVDLALDNDVAMYQMPCPEVTYLGSMRWGQVKKMYSNPMFRRHCRKIAEQVCDQIQTYRDNDHKVVGIVFRDGSPTCGLKCSAVEADAEQVWGGMVWNASPLQCFGATEGVFTEELMAELERRNIDDIQLLSLPEVPEAGSLKDALQQIDVVFQEGADQ
ncbi:CD3072 family TudS-related putative desulfidase [Vibrio sp. YIC-376]|uniref:CD3072 family TudS-related putative desulfidase n=1 Tax=Vibrio sp. YIC-376 TaxID=3136162 RepID=UPI00402AED1D